MNSQIYEDASEWVVKHRETDLNANEKVRFDAWLRESPQHVRAYLEISAVWEDVASIDPNLNVGADELIARARAEGNVVSLESSAHPVTETSRPQGKAPILRRGRVYFGLAASLVLAIAGIWLYQQRYVYSTAIGEKRSIVLSDGSTVELNSRSRIRVRYSDAERDIELIEGQALFEVAKNPQRPFVVNAHGTRIRAVGTQFDVYMKPSGTVVTVVEGKVSVMGAPHGPILGVSARASQEAPAVADPAKGTIFLAAGEQVTVVPTTDFSALPRRTNVEAATAWTQRRLVFDFSPLTEVAQEFNRYNARPLIIEDPQLAEFHVSGVFSSLEPSLLIRFLRAQPELTVEETDQSIRISRK